MLRNNVQYLCVHAHYHHIFFIIKLTYTAHYTHRTASDTNKRDINILSVGYAIRDIVLLNMIK